MPFAEAKDGVKLWFEDRGDGVPIVFVHEFGGEPASWDFQVAHFANTHRCITYAARGFQPSDSPAALDMFGQEKATSDVAAVLDHLEIERFHLAGTSMGSFTALDFTLGHPDRVRSLTLVGNSSGPRDDAERERYRNEWIATEIELREQSGGAGAVAVLEEDPAYRSFQQNLPEAWRTYADRLSTQPVAGALNILRTLHWHRRSIWEDEVQLRNIACPVLLAHGDEDYYLVGETNRYLEQAIASAHRMHFVSTGHLVNIEKAEQFNALLEEHINNAGQLR